MFKKILKIQTFLSGWIVSSLSDWVCGIDSVFSPISFSRVSLGCPLLTTFLCVWHLCNHPTSAISNKINTQTESVITATKFTFGGVNTFLGLGRALMGGRKCEKIELISSYDLCWCTCRFWKMGFRKITITVFFGYKILEAKNMFQILKMFLYFIGIISFLGTKFELQIKRFLRRCSSYFGGYYFLINSQ